jgi:hypothetical protein
MQEVVGKSLAQFRPNHAASRCQLLLLSVFQIPSSPQSRAVTSVRVALKRYLSTYIKLGKQHHTGNTGNVCFPHVIPQLLSERLRGLQPQMKTLHFQLVVLKSVANMARRRRPHGIPNAGYVLGHW